MHNSLLKLSIEKHYSSPKKSECKEKGRKRGRKKKGRRREEKGVASQHLTFMPS
jgi:hypothetical protein